MWAEVILSRDDLARLLAQMLPFTIQLGDAEKEHSLSLSDLGDVTLVADLGLRVVCKARVRWPLLGIDVPIEASSLTLVLIPTIEPGVDGDALVFRVSIEEVDFSALPALIGDRITAAVNAKLETKGAALSWNFSRTLTRLVPISRSIEPLESFSIRPAWGKVRITGDAVVYAASFHSALIRRGEPAPSDNTAPLALREPRALPLAAPSVRPEPSDVLSRQLAAAGMLAVGAGVAYLLLRHAFRS